MSNYFTLKIKAAEVYTGYGVLALLTRMRSKRDIKTGRLCTPGGAVRGIVGGGVTFRFLNSEAVLDENMLFWVLWLSLNPTRFQTNNGQNHMGFLKKSVAFGVPPAYSRYRR